MWICKCDSGIQKRFENSSTKSLISFADMRSLWVPSSNKKVGCHGTPIFSILCHSNTFCITQATPSHHLSNFFFAFHCILSLLSFLPSVAFVFPFFLSGVHNTIVSSLVQFSEVFVSPYPFLKLLLQPFCPNTTCLGKSTLAHEELEAWLREVESLTRPARLTTCL